MEDIQQASAHFFVPLTVSYAFAGAGGLLLARYCPRMWPRSRPPRPAGRWLDFALVFVTAAGILGLGAAYRSGYLLPSPAGAAAEALIWNVNNLIIYSPLFVTLILRRQSFATVYLSREALGASVLIGLTLGTFSVILFTTLRGELDRLPAIISATVRLGSLRNFLPVFLEGLALAFALVRIRWSFGTATALVVPSVLFALAHVPGQIQNELSLGEMAAYFLVTGGISVALLYTIQKTRDVIWLGIVHYLMDVATGAF